MTTEDRIDALIAEYFDRVSAGEALTSAAFIRAHPEVARQLRQQLALAPALEGAFPQLEHVPERLGAYELDGVLGRGGMGTVYRASLTKDAAGLEAGTTVALKVIHPHLLTHPGFFKRFLREAQVGQAIDHPNVVRAYDLDAVVDQGRTLHFLVMEYVEGQTLLELLSELGWVPEQLCRHIGREVSKALEAIHAANAVHRDLKPENVILTTDNVVKVMDLGVAHLADEAVRLSQTGHFIGSLEYAAPEQFGASPEGVDARADLHALGVLLYELATGRHPFREESTQAVIRRILEERPRRAAEINEHILDNFRHRPGSRSHSRQAASHRLH